MKNVHFPKMEKQKLAVGGTQILAVNIPVQNKFVEWHLEDVVKNIISQNQERFQVLRKFYFPKL